MDITLTWQWARDWSALFSTIYVLGGHWLSGWKQVAEVFIRSSQQATLPRFPQGENPFQIRNSLKWNLTKDRSHGATLIQRPLAIPTEYILYDYHLLYQWLIMDMHDELKGLYIFLFP